MHRSQYAVIRYVPDPLSEEFVNIGVAVVGDGMVRTRFVEDWGSVERFARRRIAPAVQAFVDGCRRGEISETLLLEASSKWSACLQVSELRPSLAGADELLGIVVQQYLSRGSKHAGVSQEHQVTRRRVVRKRMVSTVRSAVREVLGDEGLKLVHEDEELAGNLRARRFDLVVRNGAPIYAARAFSFQTMDPRATLADVEHMAFEIEDVRKVARLEKLPIAAVLLAPQRYVPEYDEARKAIESVGAECLNDQQIDRWSAQVARLAESRVREGH